MQNEYFASWAVPELQRIRDTNRVKHNSRSAQIFHPAKAQDAEAEQEGQSLPLFGSTSWTAQTVGPNKRQKTQKEDLLCYVGGAVWALDWCPACDSTANNEEEPVQHIAVAAHPGGRTKTVIGEIVSGPAIVQIWSAPYATEAKASSISNALPQMQLGICHEGGLTWDCKWCPSDTSIQHIAGTGALSRLGLLALVLGNGELQVVAVPHPKAALQGLDPMLAHQDGSEDSSVSGVNAALLVEVPPVAWLQASAMGGSLPCVVEWLPVPPHDLLLVGFWDGSLAVVRLQPSSAPSTPDSPSLQSSQESQLRRKAQHDMVVLTHFQVEPTPLRAVAWCPPQVGQEESLEQRCLFLTAGHLGFLRMWDSRDTSRPLYQRRVSSISRLLSLQWSYLLDPPGFLIATDDGGIVYEAGHPQEEGQSWQDAHLWRLESDKGGHGTRNITRESRGANTGAVWSVQCCPSNGLVAYAGEDGEVAIFKERMLQDNRMRRAHTTVAGVHAKEEGLELRSAQYYTHHASGVYQASKPSKLKGLAPEVQSIHRVRWSPNGGQAAWLAHGGAAGLVWLQRLGLR
ncbi:TPA: hypothetical protein ACH3X3_001521 [Trebouxia sp. C0006]